MYWNRTATVIVDVTIPKQANIQQCVRQGCILSPVLVSVFSERIFKRALMIKRDGIIVLLSASNYNCKYSNLSLIAGISIEPKIFIMPSKHIVE